MARDRPPPPSGFPDGPPPPPTDPARELDPAVIRPWPGLLTVDLGAEWAVSSLRRMRGPMRVSGGGALLDEEPFALLRAVVPARALDPGENRSVADRLRLRLRNQLPRGSTPTGDRERCHVGPLPGTCDRFSDGHGGPLRAFVAAADTGEVDTAGSPLGVVVLASGPPDRYDTVAGTGWSLATTAGPDAALHTWVRVDGWWWQETLQLDAGDRIATASVEQVWQGGLDEWTDEVFARAPFLRGRRALGERPVRVDGLTRARMYRFDWQPSGRGRMLTNVVVGIRGDIGFQLVMELPFHDDAALSVTLDDLVPSLRVGAD
ncbi:hypothetical protein [Couchioplanes caeruleus]|uniref:Uncharacterized protein n=2 Tax=Couchioplanes caeruleus TaxID=56438 RepID=A0A1K0FF65_9ACTN|nr:hypothetical protein [Couchioplanes caeruleus]OJF11479.1 hypothetical protein BG844_26085 [Couchioplanes caeruleus subsp. caeruleus]ROP28581.1 hypothetical protein EDD30_1345 [Couchioplanes caeruleus]